MAKQPGSLDLARLFQAEAVELLSAVRRGQILHATKNIRDSGSPLETGFRLFLQAKLPHVYRVLTGYLFGVNSECTPQIDVLITSSDESHEVMTSTEGASYLPFVGALALFEVKNTTYSVASSLDQMSAILNMIDSMRAPVLLQPGVQASLPEPLSIVFFGDSSDGKLADVQRWYAESARKNAPAYTVFLDRGVIITFDNFGNKAFEFEEPQPIRLKDHLNRGDVYVCAPRIRDDCVQGRTLLWMYLALADHLSAVNFQRGRIRAFTETAASTYALEKVGMLSTFPDWLTVENALKA